MMRWWLDRGVDGFRMDVINMISKDTSLPDTTAARVAIRTGDQYFTVRSAQPRVPPGDVPRGLRRPGRATCSPSARCRASPSPRRCCSPARNGTSSTWCSSSSTCGWIKARTSTTCVRCELPDLKASLASLAGRAWPGAGWNSLYFGNHDQPRSVSRFGDDGKYRVASAKTLATVLHLHHGTPYVYQGDELGMANAPFTTITDYRDIQTLNFYAEAAARGDADLPALLRRWRG